MSHLNLGSRYVQTLASRPIKITHEVKHCLLIYYTAAAAATSAAVVIIFSKYYARTNDWLSKKWSALIKQKKALNRPHYYDWVLTSFYAIGGSKFPHLFKLVDIEES